MAPSAARSRRGAGGGPPLDGPGGGGGVRSAATPPSPAPPPSARAAVRAKGLASPPTRCSVMRHGAPGVGPPSPHAPAGGIRASDLDRARPGGGSRCRRLREAPRARGRRRQRAARAAGGRRRRREGGDPARRGRARSGGRAPSRLRTARSPPAAPGIAFGADAGKAEQEAAARPRHVAGEAGRGGDRGRPGARAAAHGRIRRDATPARRFFLERGLADARLGMAEGKPLAERLPAADRARRDLSRALFLRELFDAATGKPTEDRRKLVQADRHDERARDDGRGRRARRHARRTR